MLSTFRNRLHWLHRTSNNLESRRAHAVVLDLDSVTSGSQYLSIS
jgi:hypothetical protein